MSASFMSSLAKANMNIRASAQGSSEQQVMVVVEAKDVLRVLRVTHMVFTLSQTMVSSAILGGTGKVRLALMRQLVSQRESLARNLNFGVGVNTIASSTRVVLGKNGKCLMGYTDVNQLLGGDDAVNLDMEVFTASLESDVNPHRVVVDCTNDNGVADMYEHWMSSGANVISPGRWAASGPLSRYRASRKRRGPTLLSCSMRALTGPCSPCFPRCGILSRPGAMSGSCGGA